MDRKRGCGAGLGTPQSRAGGSGPWPRCRGCQHPPASAPVSMAIPYRAASMALSHQLRSLQSSLGDPCLKDSSVVHVMSMQQVALDLSQGGVPFQSECQTVCDHAGHTCLRPIKKCI